MKSCLLLIVIFSSCVSNLPKDINTTIDTSNYFNHYCGECTNLRDQRVVTDWLRLDGAVPILMQEFKRAGYDWLYDRTLFKVDTGQYIVLTAYSRKSNFGFLYIEGHDVFPSLDYRKDMTEKQDVGVEYVSCEETTKGKPNFIRIKKLPLNVFPLNENNYWFQYTSNEEDNKILVSKESAKKILLQDVRHYLQLAPKPVK